MAPSSNEKPGKPERLNLETLRRKYHGIADPRRLEVHFALGVDEDYDLTYVTYKIRHYEQTELREIDLFLEALHA